MTDLLTQKIPSVQIFKPKKQVGPHVKYIASTPPPPFPWSCTVGSRIFFFLGRYNLPRVTDIRYFPEKSLLVD